MVNPAGTSSQLMTEDGPPDALGGVDLQRNQTRPWCLIQIKGELGVNRESVNDMVVAMMVGAI